MGLLPHGADPHPAWQPKTPTAQNYVKYEVGYVEIYVKIMHNC